jgi:transposase
MHLSAAPCGSCPVGRILKKLGMSPQRPLYRSWKQDPERVQRWKREEYPAIRARAAAEGATILFADEASVRTDYHAGATWAPVGQTPVVISSAVRHSVKIVSAIGRRGELSFQVHEGSMNAERFIEFLHSVLHDVDTPVFLVVDGSSVHRAKIVKEYVASTGGRLELFFLPPYSPELNPDEWVNKNVKHDRIARAVPFTRDDLMRAAVEALERLKKCPGIVRGFFGDPNSGTSARRTREGILVSKLMFSISTVPVGHKNSLLPVKGHADLNGGGRET